MGGTMARRMVGEPVEFGAVNGGEPFLAVLDRINVFRSEGGTLPAVHFQLDVDYETYVRMDEAGAFGLSLFSVDPATGNAAFTDSHDLELTLRLDDELLPADAGDLSDAKLMDAVLEGISGGTGRFCDPSAYHWLSVMQAQEPGGNALQGIRSKNPPR